MTHWIPSFNCPDWPRLSEIVLLVRLSSHHAVLDYTRSKVLLAKLARRDRRKLDQWWNRRDLPECDGLRRHRGRNLDRHLIVSDLRCAGPLKGRRELPGGGGDRIAPRVWNVGRQRGRNCLGQHSHLRGRAVQPGPFVPGDFIDAHDLRHSAGTSTGTPRSDPAPLKQPADLLTGDPSPAPGSPIAVGWPSPLRSKVRMTFASLPETHQRIRSLGELREGGRIPRIQRRASAEVGGDAGSDRGWARHDVASFPRGRSSRPGSRAPI